MDGGKCIGKPIGAPTQVICPLTRYAYHLGTNTRMQPPRLTGSARSIPYDVQIQGHVAQARRYAGDSIGHQNSMLL